MQQSQQTMSLVKFNATLEIHPMILRPTPLRKIQRARSMSDESEWIPLPEDPLSKQLEGIKISETK